MNANLTNYIETIAVYRRHLDAPHSPGGVGALAAEIRNAIIQANATSNAAATATE